jgi:large subunit ribosomal protein L5
MGARCVSAATVERRLSSPERAVSRLRDGYQKEVLPALMAEFGYKNVMQVPRLEKIVVNIGLGEAIQNPRALEAAERDLTAITGQHPVITRAKRSVSQFKVREGMAIGMMVTLRGNRMCDFFDKLVNVTLPRIRDFQGVPRNSFDGRGNFTLGMKEQVVFPEIEYDRVDKSRGLEISVVTTARTNEEGRRFLQLMGMPFQEA